jgi:hypothetical protein
MSARSTRNPRKILASQIARAPIAVRTTKSRKSNYQAGWEIL